MRALPAARSSSSCSRGGLAGRPLTRCPSSSGSSSVVIEPKEPRGLAASLRAGDRASDQLDVQIGGDALKVDADEVAAVIDV